MQKKRLKKILSIVGARPQFIKLGPLDRALKKRYRHVIVHTGQHYDFLMSRVFFKDLGLPKPKYDLGIGSGDHGEQTGKMLIRLETVLKKEEPDLIIVYGDTNSTLAGALAAAKLRIPLAHVEGGMRSFNWEMPEEVNRVTTDHVAAIHFCPTLAAARNLRREGINAGVHIVGDIMIDALRDTAQSPSVFPKMQKGFGIHKRSYGVLTIHRAGNTDDRDKLTNLVLALRKADFPIIFPVHPRTRKMLRKFGLMNKIRSNQLHLIEPLDYKSMVDLVREAKVILTDSGGLQKEAYFLFVPCITLREETEWTETVQEGWNTLVGTDPRTISKALKNIRRPIVHRNSYGDGRAAEKIVRVIIKCLR
ncbi:MAG: UDP-N-acetylglucosamine 2-epimerase (non-hydrolyzing) [Candidatus Kerfeldbacteria bacterium]|nr:UDP-N-acetylglucosamine 2-epimerase (non-hydrolyzing) [Candidatus Kerfeldbacteria bacterium]